MRRPIKIYLASSWRNKRYEEVRKQLVTEGYEVYDFKDPVSAFTWEQLDKDYKNWNPKTFIKALCQMIPHKAFTDYDMKALKECDVCILLLPCGRSAHLELGYAAGAGKRTIVFFDKELEEPELMYLMADHHHTSIKQVLEWLDIYQKDLNVDVLNNELAEIRKRSERAINMEEYKDLITDYETFIKRELTFLM